MVTASPVRIRRTSAAGVSRVLTGMGWQVGSGPGTVRVRTLGPGSAAVYVYGGGGGPAHRDAARRTAQRIAAELTGRGYAAVCAQNSVLVGAQAWDQLTAEAHGRHGG